MINFFFIFFFKFCIYCVARFVMCFVLAYCCEQLRSGGFVTYDQVFRKSLLTAEDDISLCPVRQTIITIQRVSLHGWGQNEIWRPICRSPSEDLGLNDVDVLLMFLFLPQPQGSVHCTAEVYSTAILLL